MLPYHYQRTALHPFLHAWRREIFWLAVLVLFAIQVYVLFRLVTHEDAAFQLQ